MFVLINTIRIYIYWYHLNTLMFYVILTDESK